MSPASAKDRAAPSTWAGWAFGLRQLLQASHVRASNAAMETMSCRLWAITGTSS